jgi:hypothetical protein
MTAIGNAWHRDRVFTRIRSALHCIGRAWISTASYAHRSNQ